MKKTGLIADIGATNARFAMVSNKGISKMAVLKCDDYPGIIEAVKAYFEKMNVKNTPVAGAISIAGAVNGDRFTMTNHPWSFSIKETQATLGFEYFSVMNDFKALALAIPHLSSKDYFQVGEGQKIANEAIGIIGPGTGLGVSSLIWDGEQYIPVPGEGGHVTMPAQTQRQYDIFEYLHHKYRHVSAERVCSGKGLVNIYNTIRVLDGHEDKPDRTPEEISQAAIKGDCELCVECLDLMMEFLGCIAGNLALTIQARGGIYIAGGIVMQMGDTFKNSRFRQAFLSKGRFEDYLAPIPTFVIQNKFTAFIGLYADLMAHKAIEPPKLTYLMQEE